MDDSIRVAAQGNDDSTFALIATYLDIFNAAQFNAIFSSIASALNNPLINLNRTNGVLKYLQDSIQCFVFFGGSQGLEPWTR